MKNKFQIMSNGQAAESFLHKKRKYSPLFKITVCKKEANVMSKIQKKQQNTFSSYNIQILKETDLKCSFCEREISQFIKIYCRNWSIAGVSVSETQLISSRKRMPSFLPCFSIAS